MNEPLADAILEIPASELQHFFDDLALTFNSLIDLLRTCGILRGRELAEFNHRASMAVKAAQSPIEKLAHPQCLHSQGNQPGRPCPEGQSNSISTR